VLLRADKEVRVFAFTLEQWILEIYRSVIDTLQGTVWMLLVFFALVAYAIVRIAKIRFNLITDRPKP
jgi:hypothetical protein